MIYTKGFAIEQLKIRINGGNPSTPSIFKDEDIAIALCNAINARLKADYLGTLAMGETIPEGCQMVTYTGDTALPVVKYGANYSMAVLPCMPVKLIRDSGVAHVSRDGDEYDPFIPVQAGMYAYYTRQKMINDLLGQIGYTVNLDKLIFYKDLTAENVTNIMVKLVVADIFGLGDYDPLPISAEMHGDLVEEVFAKLTNKPPQDKVNDVTTVRS